MAMHPVIENLMLIGALLALAALTAQATARLAKNLGVPKGAVTASVGVASHLLAH
jgi:hypothetical protein